jgi:hypothetical protein
LLSYYFGCSPYFHSRISSVFFPPFSSYFSLVFFFYSLCFPLFYNLRTIYKLNRLRPFVLQCVPLAIEPDISLIILPLMRILQRNFKRTYLIVQEMWHHNMCWNWPPPISSLVLELLKKCRVR